MAGAGRIACHHRRVTSALLYLVVMVVVAGVVFLLAAVIFGRGEQLAPLPPGATPTRLPSAEIAGADLREVRFQQVIRGYRMTEVDWVLDRVAGELDGLRNRVRELERELATARPPADSPPPPADSLDAAHNAGPAERA